MPEFPVVDAHLHVWDHGRLRYSAFEGHPIFGRSWHVEDYRAACGPVEVEAMVFLECYADFDAQGGQYVEEVEFVEDEAARDPRIRAIVPMAPLERGAAVAPMLEEMTRRFPRVRGIRRIVEFDDDPRALTLSDAFVAGVNLLHEHGLHFEINVNHTQMDVVREFVDRVPETPLILDHCGKPGIAEGALAQFRDDMAALSRHPNLVVKLSDLPVEADHETWREADIRPYVDATFEAFGFERTIFAADWPICLQATTIPGWVALLDRALEGVAEADRRAFYRGNADRFYRLGL